MTPPSSPLLSPARAPKRLSLRLLPSPRTLLILTVILVLAHLLDPWARSFFSVADLPALERRDWYRLVRVQGYLPLWFLAATALALVTLSRPRTPVPGAPHADSLRPALLLALSPALTGLAAELLKRLIARHRPLPLSDAPASLYTFKTFLRGFLDDSNLGIPSSHAAVAFAAAFALAAAFPRSALVMLPLAAACAASRLLASAHFLSDCVAAAVLAWIINTALSRTILPRP